MKTEDNSSCTFCPYVSRKTSNKKNGKPRSRKTLEIELINHKLACHFYCHDCDKKFDSKTESFLHLRRIHPNTLKECELCAYATIHLSALKSHKLLKHFTCTKCDKTFNSEENLAEHTVSMHKSRENFECQHCNYTFLLEQKLKQHVANKHSVLRYECENCGKKFKFPSELKNHYKAKKNLACFQCDFKACASKDLISHKVIFHSSKITNEKTAKYVKIEAEMKQDYYFQCYSCHDTFTSINDLNEHRDKNHAIKNETIEEVDPISVENYEETNETDSVEVVFMCVFCFEPFENDAKMQEHIENVHEK